MQKNTQLSLNFIDHTTQESYHKKKWQQIEFYPKAAIFLPSNIGSPDERIMSYYLPRQK